MHISAMEEYGLRCILQLAKLSQEGPVSASEVAEKEGISVEYVSKFMHLFKKSGLVVATRGVQGGFRLAQDPSLTALKQIFDSLKPKADACGGVDSEKGFCDQFAGKNQTCVHIQGCSVRPFWSVLSYYFDEVTKNLTLKDLLLSEVDAQKKIELLVDDKVSDLKKAFFKTESQSSAPRV